MKLIGCLTILVTILSADGIRKMNSNKFKKHQSLRITNGHPVNIITVPCQVSLEKFHKHHCGGSLISKYHILTAAHCLTHISDKDWVQEYELQMRAGTSRAEEGGITRLIELARIPAYFSNNPLQSDIGIVKLRNPIETSKTVQPIPLYTNLPKAGDLSTVTGFGSQLPSKEYTAPHTLMEVKIVLYENSVCEGILELKLSPDVMCAGNKTGGEGSCFGDSGGPMRINEALAGVVFAGVECGIYGTPTVYTAIHYHLDWINKCMENTTNGTNSC